MRDSPRSIFRDDAIRRYVESKEKSVLPRLVSPRTFIYLWFLLGFLGISSIIAWFVRIPVYASGSAVVVRWRSKTQGTPETIVVAAFFPPQSLPKLRTTQTLFLHFDAIAHRVSRSVIAVQPAISSPDAIQKQFALSPGTAQAITQPAAVAIAPLEPIPADLPASAYLGTVGRADVEIGSRRLISFLPLIGQFFER